MSFLALKKSFLSPSNVPSLLIPSPPLYRYRPRPPSVSLDLFWIRSRDETLTMIHYPRNLHVLKTQAREETRMPTFAPLSLYVHCGDDGHDPETAKG